MTGTDPRISHDPAEALVLAMAGLPAGHPARADLRDRAIEAWLPLARRLAGRCRGHRNITDDLVQTATVGLIKAVDRFDPAVGSGFAAYAVPTITGELKRYFRDRTWAANVPRRIKELRFAITGANETLTHVLCRPPTAIDIAAYLGLPEQDVVDGLAGIRAYSAASLSTPVASDGSHELGDLLGGDDHEFTLAEIRIALAPAMAGLDERDLQIVTLRYFGDLSQADIAARIGISQMHVSRLIPQILRKLRRLLDS